MCKILNPIKQNEEGIKQTIKVFAINISIIYLFKINLQSGPIVKGGFGISDNFILFGNFVYGV